MTTRASTAAASHAVTTTGEGSDTVEVVVNGMFVSPRVIDRRAFNELSGELRDLVERAAIERGAIEGAVERAVRSTAECREHEQTQSGNLELTARALKTIDERATRVEMLLKQASDQSQVFERLENHAANLIDAKIQVLESRLEAVQSAATAKTEALEERVRRASRELEQRIESIRRDTQSIAGPVQEQLAELCQRAGLLSGREPGAAGPAARNSLGDMVERAEAMAGEVEKVTRRLETASEGLDAQRRSADDLAILQREIEHRADEIRGRVEREGGEINARLDRDGAELRTRLEREGEAVCGRLEARAGETTSRIEEETNGVLTRAEEQSAQACARVEQRTQELGVQVERNAEIVRSRLQQQQAEFIGRTQEAIDQAQRALAGLEDRSTESRQAGEQAIAELRSVVQQSIDAHNTTSLAVKILNASIDQAKAITTRLEPWRPLLDGHAAAGVPEPIKRLIEGIRGELGSELSSIAGALRGAAEKAERVGRIVEETPLEQQIGAPGNPLIAARVGASAIAGETGIAAMKNGHTPSRRLRDAASAD